MTPDEELSLLDDALRRLKVEYDVFFGGGSKKPPTDTEWRVQSLIKRYSDSQRLTFAQRFKYNTIAQRYAIYSDLWRQKMKIKEEGYRRPADAALGIAGLRREEEVAAAQALAAGSAADQTSPSQTGSISMAEPFRVTCSDPETEQDGIRSLYDAVVAAKRRAGEAAPTGSFESFRAFVKRKTEQLRRQYGCAAVEYVVEVTAGQVKLKAKAKS